MASTMQEALIDAGFAPHGKQAKRAIRQVLAPHPDARSVQRLPKWLTRNGRMTGPVSDFFEPLARGKRVWIIHTSNTSYAEVVDASQDGATLARVHLAGEDQPRKFRLNAKVRYVITD